MRKPLDGAVKARVRAVLDGRAATEAELRKLFEDGRACSLILSGELEHTSTRRPGRRLRRGRAATENRARDDVEERKESQGALQRSLLAKLEMRTRSETKDFEPSFV